MVFTAKKVEVPLFGDRMKKTREVFGLSKSKVAHQLNVPEKYIDHLEAGEIDLLPAKVYVKGFLKRYAGLLNIDEKEIIHEYEKELNVSEHLKKEGQKSLPSLRSPGFIITPKVFMSVLCLFMILGVAGYFFYQLHFILAPPALEVIEPGQDARSESESFEISGRTEVESRLTINGRQAYIDKNGEFKQALNLVAGINTIEIESVNRFGKSASVVRKVLFSGKSQEVNLPAGLDVSPQATSTATNTEENVKFESQNEK